MNTIAFTIAKNNIAMFNEVAVAIKLVTRTPSTIPAETPINILDTA